MEYIFALFVCLSLVISLSSAYRILAIFPVTGRSHFNVLEPIVKGLVEKGHKVDVISKFPLEKPSASDTDTFTSPIIHSRKSFHYEHLRSRFYSIEFLHEYLKSICENLGDPQLLEIIRNPPSDPPYDALIIRVAYGYQCFAAIGHLWNVPVISIVVSAPYPFELNAIMSPLNLAFSSKNLQNYKENMTFWDRLYNFVVTHYILLEYHYYARVQDDIIKKYLGSNMPHYTQLEKEVSLILTNSHLSLHGIQPKSPAHIEIGGIHIQNNTSSMDVELRKILDGSENGFVYFSFGTFVVVESLPRVVLERFFATFRKISPIRVIMKSKNPTALPQNIPSNVFTLPWLPQQEVLQHPNIKGFLTHGGGLGSQEAVYYGVPVICVPFFVDQLVNCDIASEKGYGIKLNIEIARQEDYDSAIAKILHDPSYKTAVKRLSMIYRDRPRKPKDEAVYWIEYVINHGKMALRSASVSLSWWQVELYDIYAFVIAVLVLTIIIASLSIKYIVKALSSLRIHLSEQLYNKKVE
ncbi:hypothetical protein QAD02_015717 [Eretmocerus hayati]|uniref:Uncharacterized protein n=1 Tax=Eretmocerus hayati TaxID=131215 RepID=A0ACC2P8L0_9HYME|nr:hypothetical protein QAD02_015717 [Eretmocerus hayati]